MSDDLLIDEPLQGVRRITFNRPEALNAFTHSMYHRLVQLFEETALDLSIRVVILTGSGRGYCSGHDIKNGGTSSWRHPEAGRYVGGMQSLAGLGRVPLAMKALPQPVISAVNGTAAGIGYVLALAADLTVAARSAKFVNSIHNAGTGAELGLSFLLAKAVGSQRAAEILYTARPVNAEEAERIGLVSRMVDDDRLLDECLDIARAIMLNVPIGIWLTKQSFQNSLTAGSYAAAMDYEARGVHIAQSTEDAVEKRRSFVEKRAPIFRNT